MSSKLPNVAREWLERAHDLIVDRDGLWHRQLEGIVAVPTISRLPQEWHESWRVLEGRFRILLLDLDDKVLPKVEPISTELVKGLREFGAALEELRQAVLRPGKREFDGPGRRHADLYRSMEVEADHIEEWKREFKRRSLPLPSGAAAFEVLCPACRPADDDDPGEGMAFRDADALRAHFAGCRPRPDYGTPIVKAVERCRGLYGDFHRADNDLEREASPREEATTAAPPLPYEFRRLKGGQWSVAFKGAEPLVFEDQNGMWYLEALLNRPRGSIEVFDLSGLTTDTPVPDVMGLGTRSQREEHGAGGDGLGFRRDEIDAATKEDCKRELHEIKRRREEAKARDDEEELDRLDERCDRIEAYLTGSDRCGEDTDTIDPCIDNVLSET